MEMLETIGIFFAQTFIIVLAIIAILLTLASLALKNRHKDSFEIELLHERFEDQTQALKESFLTDQEIKTILGVATKDDEVVVKVESPGGLVHSYGYAAAQLIRVRDAGIPLTVCVDQVAASGGYLMACVGNKVIAAPFALIGSIGVVAQVPNFNRLLKKHDVDYKEYTAGDYKRTVSIFGEITEKWEAKFKEQLELTHQLFKSFVSRFRPQLDLNKVATGEFWYGETAISLGLIDEIKTSDEYLLTLSKDHHVVKISFEHKPTLMEKISEGISGAISKGISLAIRKLADQNTLVK